MGSGGVAKVGPEGALGGPGAAKSAQGPEGPRKGQGSPFLGVPFGTPICLHFCPQVRSFFHRKSTCFQIPKWSKNGIILAQI